jgi:MoxR-like ATPase
VSETTRNNDRCPCPSAAEPTEFTLPPLPSLITKPLGLEGWSNLEPVLLAALVTEEPLLLVGAHGTAKSLLLERLAKSLQMDYRFYNASLINYDDLVGVPIPDEKRENLRYISTPSAIWGTQIVFFDEISRTKPELQNKLFPIIHEKRVQGIALEGLRYRWAAMNPPPEEDALEEEAEVYFGAEPLDPALADRFTFVVEVPSWQDLTHEEKRAILRDQFAGPSGFTTRPPQLIEQARRWYERFKSEEPAALVDYVVAVLSSLESQGVKCSSRRAAMLHRGILAVHASRTALFASAWPDVPWQVIDWSTSAIIALRHCLPHTAQGKRPGDDILLAAHRHAWEMTRLDENNPWRKLLTISDPVERCLTAIELSDRMSDDDLSQVLLDSLSAVEQDWVKSCLAFVSYLALHRTRSLMATAYETLATYVRPLLEPHTGAETVYDATARARCRSARDMAARLRSNARADQAFRARAKANLLSALIPTAYGQVTPSEVGKLFDRMLDRLGDKVPAKGGN